MDYTRDSLLTLLKKLYGPYKGEDRIDFINVTSKEIASELGYDEGQFSRIVNPGFGKEPSIETYQKIINRLKQNLENKKLSNTNKRLKLIVLFLLFLLLLAAGKLVITSLNNPNRLPSSPHYTLDLTQVINLFEWHGIGIQNQLAVEGLLFNLKIREGNLTAEEENSELEKLEQEVGIILKNGRSKLEAFRFESKEGTNLRMLLDACYALDSDSTGLKRDFIKVIPYLTKKEINHQDLVKIIKNQAHEAQLTLQECIIKEIR